MDGWIKLHRQMCAWEWYDDANVFRLFIHLLLNANHADLNWRGINVKRGQKFTSIKHLSQELKLSEKAVRIALEKLLTTKEIELKGASNGTMITICKYETYQTIDEAEGQTKVKQRANEGQQTRMIRNKGINIPLWKTDFNAYLTECKLAYKKFYTDSEFIKLQSQLNPNVNVRLSITKGYENFWGTEAGWKFKKKSKTTEIDWRQTIINSIAMNKVYFTKQELSELE